MENQSETLDLSGKKLKKLNKPTPKEAQAINLILDDNELQRLDNLDSFTKVQKLSVMHNQLLRMYGVSRLHSLHTLNLAQNGILTIEGLKELVNLKYLCLARNNIKIIEHLNTNVNLEHLDLSENSIMHITDVSFLKNLKELLLHNNKIGHLRQCDRFLPTSLITLTLASNNISDLNEISQLVNLVNLHSISLANNPCVSMSGNKVGFDYRPFIINWCMNVQVIDGYIVDAIESLRGEWLYSQGRGRHFRVGDQQELSQYLATVCPLTGEQLETEEDRKLRLILSKAQHHQQQLREQINESPTPSPSSKKKIHSAKSSPRVNSSRLNSRTKSPDRMAMSCYSDTNNIRESSNIMSQSLDSSALSHTPNSKIAMDTSYHSKETFKEKCLEDFKSLNSPLQALSKLVPVPESLMSPDYRPSITLGKSNIPSGIPTNKQIPINNKNANTAQSVKSPKLTRSNMPKLKPTINSDIKKTYSSPTSQRKKYTPEKQGYVSNVQPVSVLKKSPSSEEESEICDAKLLAIQQKIQEHKQQRDAELASNSSSGEDKAENAAITIQKMWRGYYTRNKDKDVQDAFKSLRTQRAEHYIQKLANDMESTKAALESERKIQVLQMQAINALWKKVSTLQPDASENHCSGSSGIPLENADLVKDLAQTCSLLQCQIQQLQGSMQDIVKFMSCFTQIPVVNQQLKETVAATQTEIVAVHTPLEETSKLFPFQKHSRPSSLPLPISQKKKENINTSNSELQQFAGTLVDGVLKIVSETKTDGSDGMTDSISTEDTFLNNAADDVSAEVQN